MRLHFIHRWNWLGVCGNHVLHECRVCGVREWRHLGMMPPVPRKPICHAFDSSVTESALRESFVRTFGYLADHAPRSVAEVDAGWTAHALSGGAR